MTIPRILRYLESSDFDAIKDFYVGFLGMEVAMESPEMPDFLFLASPDNPSAQVVVARTGAEQPHPDLGVDLTDPAAVDAAHEEAQRRGLEVVYGLRDEPWGVRRFFVRDPSGAIVNVLAHLE